jgi:hypothetical protein
MDLWLVGNPEHYLGEDEPVTPSQLRDLGRLLHGYADEAAELVEKLTAAGWTARAGGRHVNLFNPAFESERQVDVGEDEQPERKRQCPTAPPMTSP